MRDDQPAACDHETQSALAERRTQGHYRGDADFLRDIETPAERRRAVMKIYIRSYGGISLYASGVHRPAQREGR